MLSWWLLNVVQSLRDRYMFISIEADGKIRVLLDQMKRIFVIFSSINVNICVGIVIKMSLLIVSKWSFFFFILFPFSCIFFYSLFFLFLSFFIFFLNISSATECFLFCIKIRIFIFETGVCRYLHAFVYNIYLCIYF